MASDDRYLAGHLFEICGKPFFKLQIDMQCDKPMIIIMLIFVR